MAKKKFLQENGTQVWPITRADCVYTADGKKLLSEHYASKDYVAEQVTIEEEELDTILEDLFGPQSE